MTQSIVVYSIKELMDYKKIILDNMRKNVQEIQQVIKEKDVLLIFKKMKFDKIVVEPLSGDSENLIEVINQSQTYLVSLMAVEYLFKIYPEQAFIINWGNIQGHDITSIDETIIAECFASTSYKRNGKLTEDLKRLSKNITAIHKYEFFYDKEFTENHKKYYMKKYSNIEIVKFYDII